MSIIDMGEGVLIDDSTGEIIEGVVPGADPLFWAAIKLTDALEQEKAWGIQASALKAILLKGQAEKRAEYGDRLITITQRMNHRENIDAERAYLRAKEDRGGLPLERLTELVFAAKGFERAALTAEMAGELESFIEDAPTKPFVLASVVRKLAPGTDGGR